MSSVYSEARRCRDLVTSGAGLGRRGERWSGRGTPASSFKVCPRSALVSLFRPRFACLQVEAFNPNCTGGLSSGDETLHVKMSGMSHSRLVQVKGEPRLFHLVEERTGNSRTSGPWTGLQHRGASDGPQPVLGLLPGLVVLLVVLLGVLPHPAFSQAAFLPPLPPHSNIYPVRSDPPRRPPAHGPRLIPPRRLLLS